jgi:hypothetical protein
MGLLSFDDDPPARADSQPTAVILLFWRYFRPGLTYVSGALARPSRTGGTIRYQPTSASVAACGDFIDIELADCVPSFRFFMIDGVTGGSGCDTGTPMVEFLTKLLLVA